MQPPSVWPTEAQRKREYRDALLAQAEADRRRRKGSEELMAKVGQGRRNPEMPPERREPLFPNLYNNQLGNGMGAAAIGGAGGDGSEDVAVSNRLSALERALAKARADVSDIGSGSRETIGALMEQMHQAFDILVDMNHRALRDSRANQRVKDRLAKIEADFDQNAAKGANDGGVPVSIVQSLLARVNALESASSAAAIPQPPRRRAGSRHGEAEDVGQGLGGGGDDPIRAAIVSLQRRMGAVEANTLQQVRSPKAGGMELKQMEDRCMELELLLKAEVAARLKSADDSKQFVQSLESAVAANNAKSTERIRAMRSKLDECVKREAAVAATADMLKSELHQARREVTLMQEGQGEILRRMEKLVEAQVTPIHSIIDTQIAALNDKIDSKLFSVRGELGEENESRSTSAHAAMLQLHQQITQKIRRSEDAMAELQEKHELQLATARQSVEEQRAELVRLLRQGEAEQYSHIQQMRAEFAQVQADGGDTRASLEDQVNELRRVIDSLGSKEERHERQVMRHAGNEEQWKREMEIGMAKLAAELEALESAWIRESAVQTKQARSIMDECLDITTRIDDRVTQADAILHDRLNKIENAVKQVLSQGEAKSNAENTKMWHAVGELRSAMEQLRHQAATWSQLSQNAADKAAQDAVRSIDIARDELAARVDHVEEQLALEQANRRLLGEELGGSVVVLKQDLLSIVEGTKSQVWSNMDRVEEKGKACLEELNRIGQEMSSSEDRTAKAVATEFDSLREVLMQHMESNSDTLLAALAENRQDEQLHYRDLHELKMELEAHSSRLEDVLRLQSEHWDATEAGFSDVAEGMRDMAGIVSELDDNLRGMHDEMEIARCLESLVGQVENNAAMDAVHKAETTLVNTMAHAVATTNTQFEEMKFELAAQQDLARIAAEMTMAEEVLHLKGSMSMSLFNVECKVHELREEVTAQLGLHHEGIAYAQQRIETEVQTVVADAEDRLRGLEARMLLTMERDEMRYKTAYRDMMESIEEHSVQVDLIATRMDSRMAEVEETSRRQSAALKDDVAAVKSNVLVQIADSREELLALAEAAALENRRLAALFGSATAAAAKGPSDYRSPPPPAPPPAPTPVASAFSHLEDD